MRKMNIRLWETIEYCMVNITDQNVKKIIIFSKVRYDFFWSWDCWLGFLYIVLKHLMSEKFSFNCTSHFIYDNQSNKHMLRNHFKFIISLFALSFGSWFFYMSWNNETNVRNIEIFRFKNDNKSRKNNILNYHYANAI